MMTAGDGGSNGATLAAASASTQHAGTASTASRQGSATTQAAQRKPRDMIPLLAVSFVTFFFLASTNMQEYHPTIPMNKQPIAVFDSRVAASLLTSSAAEAPNRLTMTITDPANDAGAGALTGDPATTTNGAENIPTTDDSNVLRGSDSGSSSPQQHRQEGISNDAPPPTSSAVASTTSNHTSNTGTEPIQIITITSNKTRIVSTPKLLQGKLYGFVHMAKTAGTEINGELALQMEGVCGNKGDSSTFETTNDFNHWRKPKKCCHKELSTGQLQARGFQDCSLIASEADNIKFWTNNFHQFGKNMILHVPCRDILSMLMSTSNYIGIPFNCTSANQPDDENLEKQLKSILRFWVYRFDTPLPSNFTVQCFNPIPVSNYIDYMKTILPVKQKDPNEQRYYTLINGTKVPVPSTYRHRDSNAPRHKTRECLWKMPEAFQERVKQKMIELYPYYKFCNDCMGSKDEIQL